MYEGTLALMKPIVAVALIVTLPAVFSDADIYARLKEAPQCTNSEGVPSGGWRSYFNIQSCSDEHGVKAIAQAGVKQADVYGITFIVQGQIDPVVLFVNNEDRCCRVPMHFPHVRSSVPYLHDAGVCCDAGVCPDAVLKCGFSNYAPFSPVANSEMCTGFGHFMYPSAVTTTVVTTVVYMTYRIWVRMGRK